MRHGSILGYSGLNVQYQMHIVQLYVRVFRRHRIYSPIQFLGRCMWPWASVVLSARFSLEAPWLHLGHILGFARSECAVTNVWTVVACGEVVEKIDRNKNTVFGIYNLCFRVCERARRYFFA